MRLKSIAYSEYDGEPQEWKLNGLEFGDINLIVGKNASGKSRALNVIAHLARLLANEQKPGLYSNYDVVFENDGKRLEYRLRFKDSKVLQERFSVDGELKLERGIGGVGKIFAQDINEGVMIRFQLPESEVAAVARCDTVQHPFLLPLYEWGNAVRHYYFGTPLGKDRLAVFVEKGGADFNEKDASSVVPLYRRAVKEFQKPFEQMIMTDMTRLDYPNEEIGLQAPVSLRVAGVPGELTGLYLKEEGLSGITDQHCMSQGMFRALSLIIHANYCLLSKKATCLLIDDIGEGLDFDRSCRLIDLLREKAQESSIQLIMATNDRFVMNNVPLEEWSVLVREGSSVGVRNYRNSKKLFDDFKFMGMSNFDFLAHDFAHADEEDLVEQLEGDEAELTASTRE